MGLDGHGGSFGQDRGFGSRRIDGSSCEAGCRIAKECGAVGSEHGYGVDGESVGFLMEIEICFNVGSVEFGKGCVGSGLFAEHGFDFEVG